jgi:predicted metal-dependent HD superfamily phosphohydrolase
LEVAIWFHDLIYDPRAPDNEARSAEEAARFLGDCPLIPKIHRLILATRHQGEASPGDEELIADIDLSILGSEFPVYQNYASAIRSEYSLVIEPDYIAGRTKVLSAFLERPHIFSTSYFRTTLESIARRNLESEIRSLASQC